MILLYCCGTPCSVTVPCQSSRNLLKVIVKLGIGGRERIAWVYVSLRVTANGIRIIGKIDNSTTGTIDTILYQRNLLHILQLWRRLVIKELKCKLSTCEHGHVVDLDGHAGVVGIASEPDVSQSSTRGNFKLITALDNIGAYSK